MSRLVILWITNFANVRGFINIRDLVNCIRPRTSVCMLLIDNARLNKIMSTCRYSFIFPLGNGHRFEKWTYKRSHKENLDLSRNCKFVRRKRVGDREEIIVTQEMRISKWMRKLARRSTPCEISINICICRKEELWIRFARKSSKTLEQMQTFTEHWAHSRRIH